MEREAGNNGCTAHSFHRLQHIPPTPSSVTHFTPYPDLPISGSPLTHTLTKTELQTINSEEPDKRHRFQGGLPLCWS